MSGEVLPAGHGDLLEQVKTEVRTSRLRATRAANTSISARVLRDHDVRPARLTNELAVLGAGDREALHEIGIDLAAVRQRVEAVFGPGALDRPRPRRAGLLRRRLTWADGHLPFSGAVKHALQQSLRQAMALHHRSITHVLLGLLADDQDPAARILHKLGAPPAAVRNQVQTNSNVKREAEPQAGPRCPSGCRTCASDAMPGLDCGRMSPGRFPVCHVASRVRPCWRAQPPRTWRSPSTRTASSNSRAPTIPMTQPSAPAVRRATQSRRRVSGWSSRRGTVVTIRARNVEASC